MIDPGWPLIPREVLPAPQPVTQRPRRPPREHTVPAGRQLSIFGAETTEPSPLDLAGLLTGPGRLGRIGGTARVAVPVDCAWRVHVLVDELVSRGLVVNWSPIEQDQIPDDPVRPQAQQEQSGAGEDTGDAVPRPHTTVTGFEVRTAYSSRLNALARSWPPPADRLFLSGPRLRLWVAAAGRPQAGGYALGLGPPEGWEIADAALVRAGLAGTVSDAEPVYLISGRRRLDRLAELVGERPAAAPAAVWPESAAA
jgi:hypothetical protein